MLRIAGTPECRIMAARFINVRVPEALHNQIDELAEATGRTTNVLTIDALKHYVRDEFWKVRDIRAGIREADAGGFATDVQTKAVFSKFGA